MAYQPFNPNAPMPGSVNPTTAPMGPTSTNQQAQNRFSSGYNANNGNPGTVYNQPGFGSGAMPGPAPVHGPGNTQSNGQPSGRGINGNNVGEMRGYLDQLRQQMQGRNQSGNTGRGSGGMPGFSGPGGGFGFGGNGGNPQAFGGDQFMQMMMQMMNGGGGMGPYPPSGGGGNRFSGQPVGGNNGGQPFWPGGQYPWQQGGGLGNPYLGGQQPHLGRYQPPTMGGNGSNPSIWNNQGGYAYNLPNHFGNYTNYTDFDQGNPFNYNMGSSFPYGSNGGGYNWGGWG